MRVVNGKRRTFRPRIPAGIIGMLLIAGLYVTHALLARPGGGGGLSAAWLVMLLLPGALAAHLSWRRNKQGEAAKEGGAAGLLMGHFAAVLLVSMLLVGVATTDWGAYAVQVGPQIAEGVRGAAIQVMLVVGAITALVAYAGCALAGWVGALAYTTIRQLAGGKRRTD